MPDSAQQANTQGKRPRRPVDPVVSLAANQALKVLQEDPPWGKDKEEAVHYAGDRIGRIVFFRGKLGDRSASDQFFSDKDDRIGRAYDFVVEGKPYIARSMLQKLAREYVEGLKTVESLRAQG